MSQIRILKIPVLIPVPLPIFQPCITPGPSPTPSRVPWTLLLSISQSDPAQIGRRRYPTVSTARSTVKDCSIYKDIISRLEVKQNQVNKILRIYAIPSFLVFLFPTDPHNSLLFGSEFQNLLYQQLLLFQIVSTEASSYLS